ncbi:MAG: succinate dehydrogenase/fumarate reductase iron-sulfur subunit [Dehalococcoidia bacterium]|nr:succinate dehydrogenase/fumarate reductase iron-sulfur subunit [Dehalococcoidia bacterium]
MPVARLKVWRGGDDGAYEDYEVEYEEGMVVLDVVHRLQATQTPDLAVRWNCKAGKCGSCSAEINGRPQLQCMQRMEQYPEDEVIQIAPLKTFPLIRDLVCDVSWNYKIAKTIPEFQLTAPDQDGNRRMAQIDIDRGQEFRKCIECYLCQDVCHVIRDHPDNKDDFAGPRFFVQLANVAMHPLDTNPRRDTVDHGFGLEYCNITKCCTDVCPEHIKITDNAIIPLKERRVDEFYDPLRIIGRKFFGKK